ncbi:MAG: hypothetical protein IPO68_14455 [Chitinophagaceae bacterium]|nr:hypothetical protein [Chitinophagaceae bacterium]
MRLLEKYNYFKLSFIDDNLNNVLTNFKNWLTESDENFTVESKNKIDFKLIRKPNERDSNNFKFMIFEPLTNPGQTVFFSSFGDGWYTAIYNYSRLFKKEIYQIGITIDRTQEVNPAYFFYYFKPESTNRVLQESCI